MEYDKGFGPPRGAGGPVGSFSVYQWSHSCHLAKQGLSQVQVPPQIGN
jgi:hypothetical protein